MFFVKNCMAKSVTFSLPYLLEGPSLSGSYFLSKFELCKVQSIMIVLSCWDYSVSTSAVMQYEIFQFLVYQNQSNGWTVGTIWSNFFDIFFILVY